MKKLEEIEAKHNGGIECEGELFEIEPRDIDWLILRIKQLTKTLKKIERTLYPFDQDYEKRMEKTLNMVKKSLEDES